jgi:hypothetical protein
MGFPAREPDTYCSTGQAGVIDSGQIGQSCADNAHRALGDCDTIASLAGPPALRICLHHVTAAFRWLGQRQRAIALRNGLPGAVAWMITGNRFREDFLGEEHPGNFSTGPWTASLRFYVGR